MVSVSKLLSLDPSMQMKVGIESSSQHDVNPYPTAPLFVHEPYFSFIENFITNEGILNSINLILAVLINLIFAFIIEQDRKQLRIVAKHVTFATIVYRPLGVFAFLLYLLYTEKEEVEVTSPIDLLSEEDL